MKIKEQTRKLAAGCSKHCFEVVDKIAKAEKDEKDKPTTAITIDSIEVVKDYNFKS